MIFECLNKKVTLSRRNSMKKQDERMLQKVKILATFFLVGG